MTTDLFLILNREVQGGKLTPDQSEKISNRYLELQAEKEFTQLEKSAIFRAYVGQVMYQDGDPELKSTNVELKAWQEASRKDIVENLKGIEYPTLQEPTNKDSLTVQKQGQQVLFS